MQSPPEGPSRLSLSFPPSPSLSRRLPSTPRPHGPRRVFLSPRRTSCTGVCTRARLLRHPPHLSSFKRHCTRIYIPAGREARERLTCSTREDEAPGIEIADCGRILGTLRTSHQFSFQRSKIERPHREKAQRASRKPEVLARYHCVYGENSSDNVSK